MASFLIQDVLDYCLIPQFVSDEQRQIIRELAQTPRKPQPLHALPAVREALRELLQLRCVSVALRDAVASSARTDELVAACRNVRPLHMWMHAAQRQHANKMRWVFSTLRKRRVPPMYVSDGCVGCGATLPCWWPILHHDMWGDRSVAIRRERKRNVSRKRLRAVLGTVGQPLVVGCCSQECYMQVYGAAITGPETGALYNHWCKHCGELIHPARLLEAVPSGDAASPYYCSHPCEDEGQRELNGWDSDGWDSDNDEE